MRSASKYIPGAIIPAVVNFLSIIVLTRIVSTSVYGLFILAITTGNFIVAILSEWSKQATVRYLSSVKHEKDKDLLKQVISFSLILNILLLNIAYWVY